MMLNIVSFSNGHWHCHRANSCPFTKTRVHWGTTRRKMMTTSLKNVVLMHGPANAVYSLNAVSTHGLVDDKSLSLCLSLSLSLSWPINWNKTAFRSDCRRESREIVLLLIFSSLNMTSVSAATPKTTEELLNRLVILEKFIELKSNECAYYRSKVHLMQIHPLPTQMRASASAAQAEQRPRRSISFEQSSSSTTQATRSNSIDERHRPLVSAKRKPILKATKVSIPFDSKASRFPSPGRRHRKEPKKQLRSNYAQNQNYFDEEHADRRSSPAPQLLEQMLISYAAKHLPPM